MRLPTDYNIVAVAIVVEALIEVHVMVFACHCVRTRQLKWGP